MLSLRTHKVTAILGIIMSIILCLTFTNTSAFAAVIPNIAPTAPPAPISTQGAGGYNSRTYTCIWSGFIDAVSNMKSETWFYMASNDTYTVRVNVTGSGKVTVAASLWS